MDTAESIKEFGHTGTVLRECFAEIDRLRALNVDLCNRIAACSGAMTIAAERQGSQARLLGQQRLTLAKVLKFTDEHVPFPYAAELRRILKGGE